MKAIEKAKEIGQLYRDLTKSEPNIIIDKKAYYKPEFILFVIERLEAETIMQLQLTKNVIAN